MKTTRLGQTQKDVLEHLQERGGACSSWNLRHAARQGSAGMGAVTRAAERLQARGILKRVEVERHPSGAAFATGAVLSEAEQEALTAAIRRQPRAYAFWIVATPD